MQVDETNEWPVVRRTGQPSTKWTELWRIVESGKVAKLVCSSPESADKLRNQIIQANRKRGLALQTMVRDATVYVRAKEEAK